MCNLSKIKTKGKRIPQTMYFTLKKTLHKEKTIILPK